MLPSLLNAKQSFWAQLIISSLKWTELIKCSPIKFSLLLVVTLSLNIWRFSFLPLLFLSNAFLEIGAFDYCPFCMERKKKTQNNESNCQHRTGVNPISEWLSYKAKSCVLRGKKRPNISTFPKQQQSTQKLTTLKGLYKVRV